MSQYSDIRDEHFIFIMGYLFTLQKGGSQQNITPTGTYYSLVIFLSANSIGKTVQSCS